MPKNIFVTIFFALPTGALHLLTGPGYDGPFPHFVNGYLIDICLPFTFYFLFTLKTDRWIWKLAAAGILILGAAGVELFQFWGYPVLGSTFDPLDILAYGSGIALGLSVDRWLFSRFYPCQQ